MEPILANVFDNSFRGKFVPPEKRSTALRAMGDVASLWGVAEPRVDDVAAFMQGRGRYASELKCHRHYHWSTMFAGDA